MSENDYVSEGMYFLFDYFWNKIQAVDEQHMGDDDDEFGGFEEATIAHKNSLDNAEKSPIHVCFYLGFNY